VGVTGYLKEEARHMAGLLAQIAEADAPAALRRLSGFTTLISTVLMPLPMA